jgi:peptidoglycan hydrolase CwlO-like protein
MSSKLHAPGKYYVTIGSVGRSSVGDSSSGKSIISFEKGTFTASSSSLDLSLTDVSLIESSGKADNQIDEPHLDRFLDNIFLALEATDEKIEGMQESIDSNKKDIRETIDRIKELVVDAR